MPLKSWIVPGVENHRHHPKYELKREYRKNGSLLRTSEYFHGKLHGEMKTYHPNGKVAEIAYFQYGTRFGRFREYDNAGHTIQDFYL